MYLLKLSGRTWRVAPWSQIFAAIGLGFLLLAGALLHWMQTELKPVVDRLSREQVITAFLDPHLESDEVRVAVDSIRSTLGARAYDPQAIRVQEAGEFIQEVEKFYPELARELRDLGSEAESVIPKFVSVPGHFESSQLDRIRALPGVEKLDTSQDRYVSILGAFRTLGGIARVLGFGMFLALMTGLLQLARMNSVILKDSLNVLQFWGANPLQLMAPSLLSGISVGLLGGLLAGGGWIVSSQLITERLSSFSSLLGQLRSPEVPVALMLLGVSIGLGIFTGLLGTRSVRMV